MKKIESTIESIWWKTIFKVKIECFKKDSKNRYNMLKRVLKNIDPNHRYAN